jgi:hypothetical protein
MKLLDRAKRAAIAALESIEKDTETVPRRASELSASLSRELDLTTELTRLKDTYADHDRLVRQNKAYYDLVESFQRQRDQWKEMFLKQSAENAAAQSFMNAELEKASQIISTVVFILNTDRESSKKQKLEFEHKLDTGRLVKKRFDDLLAELKSEMPPEVDFMKQRDEIAASGESPAPAFFCTAPSVGGHRFCALAYRHDGPHRDKEGFEWHH